MVGIPQEGGSDPLRHLQQPNNNFVLHLPLQIDAAEH
jgi:hypothetical protein